MLSSVSDEDVNAFSIVFDSVSELSGSSVLVIVVVGTDDNDDNNDDDNLVVVRFWLGCSVVSALLEISLPLLVSVFWLDGDRVVICSVFRDQNKVDDEANVGGAV